MEWKKFKYGQKITTPDKDEVHIWASCLNRNTESHKLFSENSLSDDELDRASRFHFKKDKTQYVYTRVLLRWLLSNYLDKKPNELRFHYCRYGKPYINKTQNTKTLSFNLSHSGGLIILAFATEVAIGVDIESHRSFPELENIAETSFSAKEIETFRSLPQSERIEAFFNCWTRKEAFIKAVGEGLSYPLKSFDVTMTRNEEPKILHIRNTEDEVEHWNLLDVTPAHGFAAALAVRGPIKKVKCWKISY